MTTAAAGLSDRWQSPFRRIGATAVLSVVALGLLTTTLATHLFSEQEQDQATRRARAIAAAAAGAFRDEPLERNSATARRILQSIVDADQDIALIAILDRHRAPVLTYGDSDATAAKGAEFILPIATRQGNPSAGDSGFARVIVSTGGENRYWLTQLLWTLATCILAAAILWTGLRRLRTRADETLALAQSLDDQMVRTRDARSFNEFVELKRLLEQFARDKAALGIRAARNVELQSQDLHAAMADAVKGERAKERLLHNAEEMVERERERIALEIHDTLNATVLSIRLYAETIEATAAGDGLEEVRHCAGQIRELASEFYASARTIVRELRPETLDTLGFNFAIADFVRTLNLSAEGCRFEFQGSPDLSEPPRALAIALYRAVQEALTNVVKHAQATSATVNVQPAPPPHHVRIVVHDNGIGLRGQSEAKDGRGGLGLIGMRERLQRVGGSLSLTSAEHGTCITMLA
jgi:two-component system, NarL family, sensor histidine kinase UhpB